MINFVFDKGNPKGCVGGNVAKTPVYSAMGSAGEVMEPD